MEGVATKILGRATLNRDPLWFFFHADIKMYKTSIFELEQGFRGCFADRLKSGYVTPHACASH